MFTSGSIARMPSVEHEMLIDLFRHQPSLAGVLSSDTLGVKVPSDAQATLESGDLTECVPTEYRADAVVILAGRTEQLAVVVEVQRGRDEDKKWSWPAYLATLRARLRCPTALLVVCPDDTTAGWCGRPIDLGHPGLVLHPLVLGPRSMPATPHTPHTTERAELAVLSALAHPNEPGVLEALVTTLWETPSDRARLYADYCRISHGLPDSEASWRVQPQGGRIPS